MKLNSYPLLIVLFIFLFNISIKGRQIYHLSDTIVISGQVTDFTNNPIDSSVVRILDYNFNSIYETFTNHDGYYSLNIAKGNYMAMFAMREKEYPKHRAVPEEDMRLEFWSWNIIANEDLTINPHYHKLELYRTNVFKYESGFMIYTRPMSLTEALRNEEKDKVEQRYSNLSVKMENIKFQVFADNEPLEIYSIQAINEYSTQEDKDPMGAYLIQVSNPQHITNHPHIAFRIVAENTKHKEKGENIYFYKKQSESKKY